MGKQGLSKAKNVNCLDYGLVADPTNQTIKKNTGAERSTYKQLA